jgi:sec-independent protein translocase protein TatB
MFDIAFSELLVIGVVALVVIGPERLPKVARTMGHLFGRLQRYVSQVKSDINREMELSELSKVKTEFEGAAREFQRDIELKVHDTEHDIREVETEIDRQLRHDGAAVEQPSTPQPPLPQPAEPAAIAQEAAAPHTSLQLELLIDDPAATRQSGAT